jgi:undecaprenyl-diphosphatase
VRAGLPDLVRRRLDPTGRYGLRLTLFAAAVVLVSVPFTTLLFQVLDKGSLTRLDGEVANSLNRSVHGSRVAVDLLQTISFLGKPVFLALVIAVAAGFAWHRGRHRVAAFLVTTSLGGGLVDSAVKILVDRPRPKVDHPVATALGKSFPSGHSMSSTIVYGAVLLVYMAAIPPRRRRLALAATTALVVAIGASRLFLGVHFLTDVLGGYVLGLAWLAGATAVFEVWREERGRQPAEPLTEGVEPEAGRDLKPAAGSS